MMIGESDLARGTYLRVSFVRRWISLLGSKIKDNSRPVETTSETRITSARERDILRILFRYSQNSIPTHEVGLYAHVNIQKSLPDKFLDEFNHVSEYFIFFITLIFNIS